MMRRIRIRATKILFQLNPIYLFNFWCDIGVTHIILFTLGVSPTPIPPMAPTSLLRLLIGAAMCVRFAAAFAPVALPRSLSGSSTQLHHHHHHRRPGDYNDASAEPASATGRRAFLGHNAALAASFTAAAAAAAANPRAACAAAYLETPEFRGMDSGDENKDLPQFTTLPSGVRYIDVVVGKGEEATAGRSASLQWVLRRQNGYFVDASSEHNFDPFIYRIGVSAGA